MTSREKFSLFEKSKSIKSLNKKQKCLDKFGISYNLLRVGFLLKAS